MQTKKCYQATLYDLTGHWKPGLPRRVAFKWNCCDARLPAQSELLNQCLIGCNVTGLDVIKQITALANH